MTQDGNIYSAAERRLTDAIRAGRVCDFTDGVAITAEQMATWGPERTIRAALLSRLLTAEDADCAELGVQLRGAAIEGILDLAGLDVLPLELRQCRIDTVEASRATFTGNARFDGTTFTSDARFRDATFTSDARFRSATFTGDARFGCATFTGNARFGGATFTGNAWFGGATFTGDAQFMYATFTHSVGFDRATFTSNAWFNSASFIGNAWFDDATFTGDATFTDTIATGYDFSQAQFYATDPGPWI